jgi:hypothetical protein
MPQPLVAPPCCNQSKAILDYPTPLEIWAVFHLRSANLLTFLLAHAFPVNSQTTEMSKTFYDDVIDAPTYRLRFIPETWVTLSARRG